MVVCHRKTIYRVKIMGLAKSDYSRLSKTISHALRHQPWTYELELDESGWVAVSQLLDSLRQERQPWHDLAESDLAAMIAASSKQRYEIQEGRIRAIYGHSIPGTLKRNPATPPEILYHGTNPSVVPLIQQHGLKPMRRHNVHLSVDEETALEVGRRKSKTPTLLRIQAQTAHAAGITFYEGNDKVWLADEVPPGFIEF